MFQLILIILDSSPEEYNMKYANLEERVVALTHLTVNGIQTENITVDKGTIKSNCSDCIHARCLPNDSHILCANPSKNVKGSEYGYSKGYFHYPVNFDPTWRINECDRWFPNQYILNDNKTNNES